MVSDIPQTGRALEQRLRALEAELAGQRAQAAAAAEILQAINNAKDDIQPVFDAILEHAATLCQAPMASLNIIQEGRKHALMVAHWGEKLRHLVVGETIWQLDSPLTTSSSMREGRVMQEDDLAATQLYGEGQATRTSIVDLEGVRTFLSVPLLKDGGCLGNIALYRREVMPFTDEQIALVETFAAQAVIAIENVRQFREIQDRLARETATSEVLKVIGQTQDDEVPVFRAILEKAQAICNAPMAGLILATAQDDAQTLAAHIGILPKVVEFFESGQMKVDLTISYAAKCIVEAKLIAFDDMGQSDLYIAGSPVVRSMVDDSSIRSVLFVPLIKDSVANGLITLFRHEVNPFTENEIALVETFAAQAVIAIENVRQFKELQDSLEKQEATSEVLKVISSAASDIQPVFDMIARSATDLCGSRFCMVYRYDGALMHYCASYGFSEEFIESYHAKWPAAPQDGSLNKAVLNARQVVRLKNAYAEDYSDHAMAREWGFRQMIGVPVMQGTALWGTIIMGWPDGEAPRTSDIDLARTFADQATIAIENARLLDETLARAAEVTEALEHQKASAEILSVISQSVKDTQPVFEKILESCKQLFGGEELDVLLIDEQGLLQVAAYLGQFRDELLSTFPAPWEKTPPGQAIKTRQVANFADIQNDPDSPPVLKRMAQVAGYHSVAFAPMIWEGKGIGVVGVARSHSPFNDKELRIMQGFADQAVIAIQNARMFNDTQTALVRQTASADILRMISESVTDVTPVFEAIVQAGVRLVPSNRVVVMVADADTFWLGAQATPEGLKAISEVYKIPIDPDANFP